MGTLDPADLFVLLERTFRRRARDCRGCGFSLPFRVEVPENGTNWSAIPAQTCSPKCQGVFEELLAEFQRAYRLAR
jgi:hypothetical protein